MSMTNEIKLIALDLDGTLLNNKKEISKRNQEAIQAARQKGVKVVITTGRPLAMIEKFIEILDMPDRDDYSITFNGGLVQRNTGEILSKDVFELSELAELKTMATMLGLPFDVLSDNHVLVTESPRRSKYSELNKELIFEDVKFESLREGQIYNKAVACTDPEVLDLALTQIPTEITEKYEIFKTRDMLLEFMPKGIDKAYGLSELIKHLGIARENVMVMGDEGNDLPMIKWAGYGVAMGNAVAHVKAGADIISDYNNEEDAVARIIEDYVL